MAELALVRNPVRWIMERRKRVKPPPSLLISGILLLLLPFFNYIGLAYSLKISPRFFVAILRQLGVIELLFIVLAMPVGVGLLLVKRLGWWSALLYGGALILYNLIVVILSPAAYNYYALGQTVVAVCLMIYFVRKDISAPYMKMYPRGWRLEKRIPLQFEVIVDGIRRKAMDAGEAGIYVEWPGCYRTPGEEVHLTMRLGETEHQCKAGVVRVDSNGAGMAFRETTDSFRSDFRSSLNRA